MTQDEIIRMAREAEADERNNGWWEIHTEDLERFAALVAAHEREACAKVCEELDTDIDWIDIDDWKSFMEGANICAAAIRARSDK